MVGEQRPDPGIDQFLCYRRCPVAGVHDHRLYPYIFDLFIQLWKCYGIMLISRMDTVSQDSPVFVTRGLHTVGKHLLVFSLVESAALRVSRSFFDLFFFSSAVPASGTAIFVLQRFLPARFPVLLYLFTELSLIHSGFLTLLLFARALMCVASTNSSDGSTRLYL